jgi:hypothetical protein
MYYENREWRKQLPGQFPGSRECSRKSRARIFTFFLIGVALTRLNLDLQILACASSEFRF